MSDTTIVGWKDEQSSRGALDWALNRRPQGTIMLAHVVGSDVPLVETFAADSRAAHARIALMEMAEQVRLEHPSVTVHSELVQGDPVDALMALSGPQDLVVVGSRRHSESHGAHAWSTGARLSASANGPVAVIPSSVPSGSGVVVGVDDSAEGALQFAAEEAQRRGETLHAVRAWQAPHSWAGQGPAHPDYLVSIQEMYVDILRDALAGIVDKHPDLQVRSSVLEGDPRRVLHDQCEGASMLVVGNHGQRGPKRFFLGSVSHALVLASRVPTVVVNKSHED